LTTADFDGDGYDDLAIGVPDEDIGATTDAGAVNILLGSPLGLDAGGNQLFDQTFIGLVEAYDKFGSSLTAGDFENDGYEDLAVGVPYEDVGTLAAAGAVNIFHGSDIGLTSAGAQEFNQNSTSVLGASETSDLLGFSVAAGFFNGDFYADLAIGAPGEAIGTLIGAGCVKCSVRLGSRASSLQRPALVSGCNRCGWDLGSR
jgi:hypothetical protein